MDKIVKFAEDINADVDKYDIKVYIEQLEEVWSDFRKFENSLIEIPEIGTSLDKFEENYTRTKAKLKRHYEGQSNGSTSMIDQSMSDFITQQKVFFEEVSSIRTKTSNTDVKLPRIQVPHFGGNFKEWRSFRDLYVSSIDSNKHLTNVQKFQYLTGYLKDEAAAYIRHIPVTNEHYSEAWCRLSERYDKSKSIISSFIETFLEQNKVSNASYINLRSLCNIYDESYRGLNALGDYASSRDPWLIYLASSNLDTVSRQLWASETADNQEPTFEQFLKFLSRRCDAIECSHSKLSKPDNITKRPGIKSYHSNSINLCPKCSANHSLNQCQDFKSLDIQARRLFLNDMKLCFNCLYTGHRVNRCRSRYSCQLCQKRHHTLVHSEPLPLNPNVPNSQQSIKPTTTLSHSHSINIPSSSFNCNQTSINDQSHSINIPSSSFNCNYSPINDSCLLPNQQSAYSNPTLRTEYKPQLETKQNRESVENSTSNKGICTPHLHDSIPSTSTILTSANSVTKTDQSLNHVSTKGETSDNANSSNLPYLNPGNDLPMNFNSLLPTVIVHVRDRFGSLQSCRALIDSGSEASFISENCMQRLSLERSRAKILVSGIATAGAGYTRGVARLHIYSKYDVSNEIQLNALILPTLTANLPTRTLDTTDWQYIKNLQLADPKFYLSSPIDVIIGSDKCFEIILSGKTIGPENHPIAQKTMFGWVLCGNVPINANHVNNFKATINFDNSDLDKTLRKFWELEELPPVSKFTEEELACEQFFSSTHRRSEDGKFVVKLPFKRSVTELGNSYNNAATRLRAMERKFRKNEQLKFDYASFINEYLTLGHMEEIPEIEIPIHESHSFYLPHHSVFKESSSTTKLRVVFDGSAKMSSNISLNDKLMVGAMVQKSLFSTLVKFRKHKIAFSADIKQMYRQVELSRDDIEYQRVLWRANENEPIRYFRLLTVTYGLASSSFLATRALIQLAKNHKQKFPEASDIIENDFYVDDLMTGAEDVSTALDLQQQLITILNSGSFPLRKWKSNCTTLLESLPSEFLEASPLNIKQDAGMVDVLGIQWLSKEDVFGFTVLPSHIEMPTKRTILSDISKVFDPLGWLSPSTILVKILLQDLWLLKINWDEPVPPQVIKKWNIIRKDFCHFSTIKIPRCIKEHSGKSQLHGFSDASQSAYSAVVYLRTSNDDEVVSVRLVAAKTRVAPLKQISIPRLELCGALLLSKLLQEIQMALNMELETFAWTDSTTVLAWLSSHPRKWKNFVANRTSEILSNIPHNCWRHVRTHDNPADAASRGILPSKLVSSTLWWQGPEFLRNSPSNWPLFEFKSDNIIVESKQNSSKTSTYASQNQTSSAPTTFLLDLSKFTWNQLTRILTWCRRYISNSLLQKCDRNVGPLTNTEIQQIKFTCYKIAQQEHFSEEYNLIKKNREISSKSKLRSLHPFIDNDDIIRVGGRLQNINANYDTQHQIIMPKQHVVTSKIIADAHLKNLHSGNQLTFAMLRQRYWIIGSRDVIRRFIHNCKPCFKQRAKLSTQLMGSLPHSRINPSTSAFEHTGVDYAGPIAIKLMGGRNSRRIKAYISVFVCFTTKALHIELVSDLTTESFLAALKRFVARRGKPHTIYSDNGSNFVGANRELQNLYELLKSQTHNELVSKMLANDDINWKFQPPYSPHFGGLWEAGVKSIKTHLQRVIGETVLNFEEMTTLLYQIESILNSRPLCQISNDINDMQALTPAHFLIGRPLTSIAEPDLGIINIGRLSRWQLVQHLTQSFWKRWSSEYITTLQQRPKWQTKTTNFKENDLVLLKDKNITTTRWALGRIIKCYPGRDDVVRVVDVRTKDGIFKRSISTLCKLPADD